jgi:hypothetical protein
MVEMIGPMRHARVILGLTAVAVAGAVLPMLADGEPNSSERYTPQAPRGHR